MEIILVRGYCKQADADLKVSLQSHLFEIYWDESACYVSRKAGVGTVLRQWQERGLCRETSLFTGLSWACWAPSSCLQLLPGVCPSTETLVQTSVPSQCWSGHATMFVSLIRANYWYNSVCLPLCFFAAGSQMQQDQCEHCPCSNTETLPSWFSLTLQSVQWGREYIACWMGGCQVPSMKFYLEDHVSNPDIANE